MAFGAMSCRVCVRCPKCRPFPVTRRNASYKKKLRTSTVRGQTLGLIEFSLALWMTPSSNGRGAGAAAQDAAEACSQSCTEGRACACCSAGGARRSSSLQGLPSGARCASGCARPSRQACRTRP
eukprot:5873799-Prymnesium_polylepis.1